jgi:hypothetical protein
MFKVIYADTTSMVKKYAEYAKYTVVIRFDRKDIDENTPPAEAVQRMNKQVVYYRADDDITDVVLSTLNKQYEGSRVLVLQSRSARQAVVLQASHLLTSSAVGLKKGSGTNSQMALRVLRTIRSRPLFEAQNL